MVGIVIVIVICWVKALRRRWNSKVYMYAVLSPSILRTWSFPRTTTAEVVVAEEKNCDVHVAIVSRNPDLTARATARVRRALK